MHSTYGYSIMMLANTSAGLRSSRSGLPRMSSYDANPPAGFCSERIVSTAAHRRGYETSSGRWLRVVHGHESPAAEREFVGGKRDAREVLEQEHALHAFGSTVADRVPLLPRRERPRALGAVPERLAVVPRVVADLAPVEPRQELRRRRVVLGARGETRLDEPLGDKGCVPQLRAVRARHHHAILGHPHCRCARFVSARSALECAEMEAGEQRDALKSRILRRCCWKASLSGPSSSQRHLRIARRHVSWVVPPRRENCGERERRDRQDAQHVHRLAHGPDRLVRRVLILHDDEPVRPLEALAANPRGRDAVVAVERGKEHVGDAGMRRVDVGGRDAVAQRRPRDRRVGLGVELLCGAISITQISTRCSRGITEWWSRVSPRCRTSRRLRIKSSSSAWNPLAERYPMGM